MPTRLIRDRVATGIGADFKTKHEPNVSRTVGSTGATRNLHRPAARPGGFFMLWAVGWKS
jgi:hypothetical protein